MAFRSGKTVSATVAATTLKVKKVTVTPKKQKLDVTTGSSSGRGEYITGIVDVDFEIEGDHNVSVDNPVSLAAINDPATDTVAVTITTTTGVTWTLTTAFIETMQLTADVRGLVSFRITGSGSGSVTAPAL
jgi:hypothetical protein